MARVVDWCFRALRFLVALCLATMVALVFGNVVLRYVFATGIVFSEEFSRWLFVWLTFFGAIVAMKEHTHLGMDSVNARLSLRGKKIAYAVSHVLMLGCAYLLLAGGWQQTLVNVETKAAATGLSAALFHGVIVVFAASAIRILLYDLYLLATAQLKEADFVQVRESEDEVDLDKVAAEAAGNAPSARRDKR
jgi:TRAP-type transport system small permease protein